MPNFDVAGLRFEVLPPEELLDEQWADIQTLERAAFNEAFPNREQIEIDNVLRWGNLRVFKDARINPASDIDRGRLKAGQRFGKPIVGLAYDNEHLTGYVYSADNASGSRAMVQAAKMLVPTRRYAWFREISVQPEYQGRGIAHVLGYLSLEQRNPLQPVTAYVWLDNPRMRALSCYLVNNLDFERKPSSVTAKRPFGALSDPVAQERLAAKSSGRVMSSIATMPRAADAITHAKRINK